MTAVRDIANTYGISESGVNSMLFRLRKKLKAALEQEGIAV
jgi:DNA-directed RNA polymerase specialized sigma24 family protein